MAIKKSELYSSIWSACDALRGGMDASQYKDYVLVLLFVKYVSDKYAGKPFSEIKVPKGASFADMVALKGKPAIGDQINKKIIAPLFNANRLPLPDGADFNESAKLGSGKELVDRLTSLIAIFEDPRLDFSKNRAGDDDLMGDAYEYLMRHFATESGKSKGQFYTPAEVSRVIAQVLGIAAANTTNQTSVYDPTCGSGSLLLKVADAARARVSLFGQEKDSSTAGLARMNMILHANAAAEIEQGNTLTDPKYLDHGALRVFDYVVANPPFSDKRWSTGLDPANDPFGRFEGFGVPPPRQGDYAYLLHIVRSLKSTGQGACVLPHGVLFRGNAEAAIRKNLIRRGYIKGIIGLPPNLFYGTGIPACIVVLDKKDAQARKGIFMIDASAGFMKDGPKNRLRERDIHKIVDAFQKLHGVPKYARMVPLHEIEKNDFNLNLPRYIDSCPPEDRQDIEAHLKGSIPETDVDALGDYWAVCPDLRTALFKAREQSSPLPPGEGESRSDERATGDGSPGLLRRAGQRGVKAPATVRYCDLAIPLPEIKTTIQEHPQFKAFIERSQKHFATWRDAQAKKLKALVPGFHPKDLIGGLSENLLAHYRGQPLIDAYAIYQHLLDYWTEAMQDDCYAIAAEGWKAEPQRVIEKDKKGKEKDKGWACDLVPKSLLVARYFKEQQEKLDALAAELESTESALAELEEEQSGEDGAFSGFDKINAKSVKDRLDEMESMAVQMSREAGTPGATAAGITASFPSSRRKPNNIVIPGPSADSRGRNPESSSSHSGDADQTTATSSSFPRTRESSASETDDATDEAAVLKRWLELDGKCASLKKRIKQADAELDAGAFAKYPQLSETEIKTLVVDDKWLASLANAVNSETERTGQNLTRRVKELAERYATPLPQLESRVDELQSKVDAHLKRMGFAWA